MMQIKKIKIYIKYSGDMDAFAIGGTKKEKSIINDKEWMLIDGLIHDIELINKNLASKEMKERTLKKLNDFYPDEICQDLIWKLAQK